MTFDELVSGVVLETNRPDLGSVASGGNGDIPQKVFNAILTLHTWNGMFAWQDIETARLSFEQSQYIQTVDLRSSVFPRFRALSYIRKWDNSLTTFQAGGQINISTIPTGTLNVNNALAPIEIVDAGDYLDPYFHTEKTNLAYAAGDTLFIKSNTPLPAALIGWYAYPFLDRENNGAGLDSWIAREFPQAIIYHAASAVFSATGYLDQSRKYDSNGGLVSQQVIAILNAAATAQGR